MMYNRENRFCRRKEIRFKEYLKSKWYNLSRTGKIFIVLKIITAVVFISFFIWYYVSFIGNLTNQIR